MDAAVQLCYDFVFFLTHYAMHRYPALWATHKVHHSAKVLTPLTRYREHFIDGPIWASGAAVSHGFAAADPAAADAWHAAGLANGGSTCEEPPGVRESGLGNIYLAYLRDPAGNKICALHRMA
jgi:catechol 2,3-dioxygenase-like lactoylglutathione lyase family enzyme